MHTYQVEGYSVQVASAGSRGINFNVYRGATLVASGVVELSSGDSPSITLTHGSLPASVEAEVLELGRRLQRERQRRWDQARALELEQERRERSISRDDLGWER
jgi:hypothetical protein